MAESSNRQKDIYLKALDLPSPGERAAFLAQACAGDDALRQRVEALLKANAAPDSFLEKPAAALGVTVDESDGVPAAEGLPGEGPGTRVGPYKLLEQIGEGGMGVVYVAEQQEPVRRLVALKIIKPGMDSGQVLARFEAERQALALMDHPNIAKVLDAGATATGRPFFVMELVKGTPITTFCDANKLSPRQRLELFVPVCQAIQHAHQKGVIHRDLKPSNVLIALYDDKPVPKVIDFGIAKAARNPLTERTLHTGFGAIVGTPEYMSPEQATFNQLDIDTRSDVYSLGVLLYELLTGTTPVDKARFKEAAILEMLRVVREEEPPRPSVKLSTTAARASIAATRGTDSDKLAQLLRGELDWIVMKSLEKDRNRRYETAAGLARDVDRYLKDELVEARPPSAAYRLRKFVKRNRGTVLAAILVLLASLAGMAGTTWGLFEARHERDDADRARLDETAQRKRAQDNEAKAVAAEEDTAKALTRSDGLRMVLQSELTRPSDPTLALLLAIEGAERAPGRLANNTLLVALDKSREERTLPGGGRSLSLSSDGRLLVSVMPWTGTIWDLVAGREVARFEEANEHYSDGTFFRTSNHWFNGVCFEPNGKRVLTTSTSGRVRLWDAANGKALTLLIEGKVSGNPTAEETAEDLVNDRCGYEYPSAAQFSPDGRFILTTDSAYSTCSTNGKVRLWDARTGKEHLVLEGHKAPVFWSSFSKDGKKIITASRDGTARIWGAASGKQLLVLKGHSTNALLAASFSPDGTRALTVASVHHPRGFPTNDPVCRLWDIELWGVETGKEVATLGGPQVGNINEPFPSQAQFSPDGACVLTYDYLRMVDNTASWHLWDAKSGKHLGRIQKPGQAVFSPDGTRVAIFGGKVLELWNVKTIKRIESLEHGMPVTAAIFSADGQRLVTADGTGLHIWAIAGEAERRQGRWTEFPVLAASQNGRSLVTRTADPQEIALYDLNTARLIARIKAKDSSEVNFARFSPDGTKVIFGRFGYQQGEKDENAYVGDVRTGQIVAVLRGGIDANISTDNLRAVTINPGGRLLRLWDLADGKEIASQKLHLGNWFFSSRFSPDGRSLVTGQIRGQFDEDMGQYLRDAATAKEVAVLRYGRTPINKKDRAIFSPDSRRVLTTHTYSNPQVALVWETANGKQLSTLRLPDRTGKYGTAEFSSDGACIIFACPDGTARIFETETGNQILVLTGHDGPVYAAAFSPDKGRVVTASADKTVRLWDARTGELQSVFHGHQEAVTFAKFIPEGRILSMDNTAGYVDDILQIRSGSARVWPVDPLLAAKARAPRQLTAEERKQYEVPTAKGR